MRNMDNQKSFDNIIKASYPILSVTGFILMTAIIFDTFDLALDVAFYNLLIAMPLFGAVLMLTRRIPVSVILCGIILFVLFYIDQYVYSVRLTHIRYSDLNLIPQALRVAGRYRPTWSGEITRRLAIVLAIGAFLIFIRRYYQLTYSKKAMFIMGLGILTASAVILLSGTIPAGTTEDFDFTADAERRGFLYSWYCQARAETLKAPEGYSRENAEEILAKYAPVEGANDVRIIVIMNESLSDYSLIGKTRFEDPLPFIHSLDKNAFEGKLAVSVFGGGTSTTEFEFLTGNTVAFLPEGCTPYLQYVNHEMENIVKDLGSVRKIAIHPYYSEEWNRTQVYRFFGFDCFISGADFGTSVEVKGKKVTSRPSENIVSFGEGPLYIRGLISDKSCYERIQQENADFTFAVTMQNHGSYEYSGDDFSNREYVTEADRKEWTGKRNLVGTLYNVNSDNTESELYKVNQFLTLSNMSDQAFAELVEALEQDDQKTLVLLFGDHQPGILLSEHYVDCEGAVDIDYTVPYILWANYDIEFDAPEITSPNYLSAILKKNAGLPLTEWDQFRLDMMQEYPVVTANYIMDKAGETVGKGNLKDYEIVQYKRMFDR